MEVLDLAEHELRSLRRFLNTLYPDLAIYISRPEAPFERPALFLKESAPRRFEDRGRGLGVLSEASWQIEVLGVDYWGTKRDVAKISSNLLHRMLVPLYLWGWRYPPPEVVETVAGGSLPAGELSIAVTAVDVDDKESLAEAVAVTVPAAGSSVRLRISPWPRQSGVAVKYRVYAGAEGEEKLALTIDDVGADPMPVEALLTALPAPAAPALPDSSVMFFRFMRVEGVQTDFLEHPQIDGVFNGIISLQTSVLSQRYFPGAPVVEEIHVQEVLA